MKKAICVFLTLLTLLLCGCSESQEKSLYDHGMDVIALMAESASSPAVVQAYTGDTDIIDLASEIGTADYSRPVCVYRLEWETDIWMDLFVDMDGETGALSESQREWLKSKTPRALAGMINGRLGALRTAVGSIFTVDKMFVYPDLQDAALYLYLFDGGYPVMVSFVAGEDGAVLASGTFLMDENLDAAVLEETGSLPLTEEISLTGHKIR